MPQIDLSHHQRCILETACTRADGELFPVMQDLKGGAVGNICKSLLGRQLAEETPSSKSDLIWRYDEALGPVTLRVTKLARIALGLVDAEVASPTATSNRYSKYGTPKQSPADTITLLMQQPDGVSMKEMVLETGWQPHSIRGLISGVMRKRLGTPIETVRDGSRGTVYRIASSPTTCSQPKSQLQNLRSSALNSD